MDLSNLIARQKGAAAAAAAVNAHERIMKGDILAVDLCVSVLKARKSFAIAA